MKVFTFLVFLGIIFIPFVAAEKSEFAIRTAALLEEMRDSYDIDGEIKIKGSQIDIGAAETRRYPFKKYTIILDSAKLQNTSDSEMKGLLAHELAHLENYSEKTYFQFALFTLKYLTSEKFRIKTERKTDKKAIERGFGKELLEYRKFRYKTADKKESEFLKKYYLSPEEINQLI